MRTKSANTLNLSREALRGPEGTPTILEKRLF